MAYLDISEAYPENLAQQQPTVTAPVEAPVVTDRLSPLEWSVVALARGDRISSLYTPGRIAVAMGRIFGTSNNPRLADPRLEALRRLAVLAWHHGHVLPTSELARFFAAGFTSDQLETLLKSISGARTARGRRLAAPLDRDWSLA